MSVVEKTESGMRFLSQWERLPTEPKPIASKLVELVKNIREGMPEEAKAKRGHDLSEKLMMVKILRDKVITHSDHVEEEIPGATRGNG